MFDNVENVKLVSSYKGVSKLQGTVENRKSNGFIFKLNGYGEYDFGDRALRVGEGEVLFLPKGACYNYRNVCDGEPHYMSINFLADITEARPTVLSLDGFAELDYMTSHFADMLKLGGAADRYKCMAMLYNLLAHASGIEHASYSDKHKSKVIEPAVKYMREHMFDPNLCVDTLHCICGISDTYFRRIFIASFGMSPRKYIISKRISQAKAIIDSGVFDTVGEVALSVGYTDPLYFSRAFKAHYGVSPSELS
ncbi:MAG: helix-turn-helix transcriptional regulator [Clostridia bacterium]|nr:helix-turn-helix transcriptional regulator [Clostridia bacterium]